uniref:Uncharacterized protein n=1 Tax=Arundo donax TaxID=35708 RepID=A0A0A8XYY6_ARUDO
MMQGLLSKSKNALKLQSSLVMSSQLHFVQQTRKPWMTQMDLQQQSQNDSGPRTDSTSPMKCQEI